MEIKRQDGGFLGQPAWLWSLGALVLGVALSGLGAFSHQHALLRAEHVQLERLAESSFDGVAARLQTCGMLVRSVQALFLASDEVTPAEFEAMYANLRLQDQFPSLQALAYAARDGAEENSGHYVTTLVAPLAGNQALIGLDIITQPANLAAAQSSLDSDEPMMSEAFELIQGASKRGLDDGVTIRLPVFSNGPQPIALSERRSREIGTLAASFRASDLIERALPDEALDRFQMTVIALTEGGHRVLYQSGNRAAVAPGAPLFQRDIRYGGRTWRMQAQAVAALGAGSLMPWVTFGIGVLASALLAMLAWSVASTRARALRLANRMASNYRQSEERFRVLNDLLPALVMLAHEEDGLLVYANQACRDRLSVQTDLSAVRLGDLVEDPALRARIAGLSQGTGTLLNESARLQAPGQEPFWATLSVSRIMLGEQPHLLAVANDITELRVLSEELSYQASHDSLTSLYNRREFERQLRRAIRSQDAGAPAGALLYMDLDQFKLVNDTSGHFAGDQLLAQLASLFTGILPDGAVVARLGGDEFAILVDRTDEAQAVALAEKVRQEIDGYVFGWEQRNYTISASIGVVMLSGPGQSQRALLSYADTACYMAKERGRNRVHLYSESDATTTQRRTEMEWAGRIRQALAEDRFVLHFQELAPLWEGEQSEGVHMEMLVRLRDDTGAIVPPGAFIPAAERFGLMPQLDRWVVDKTLANFDRLHPSGKPLALCAINLSGPTFEDETFADFVLQRLQQYGVSPTQICFEITETAAMSSMTRAVEFMQRLRSAGCKFSLDDFGSGMASFGYLKNLPVDFIKIDGSFIRNIESDPVSYSIVRAVTDIGHQLGLKVVAEWVADERVCDLLRGLSVDYAQGFAIHRPQATLCFQDNARP